MPSTGSNSSSRNSGSVLSQADPAEAGHSSPLLEILSKPGHLDRVAQNLQVRSNSCLHEAARIEIKSISDFQSNPSASTED